MALQTRLLAADPAGLAEAVALLQAGALVAIPTETVYGLAGDASQDIACARIFEAKGRPRFNPLIAHVSDMDMARAIARFDTRAEALAAAFWPGPLTLVLPRRPDAALSDLVTAGLDTVAIRMPAHPLAQALIAALGRPLAAPSANRSGRISPSRAEHVLASLGGRIAAVLDGGPCAVGVESTILGLAAESPAPVQLLRPGGLAQETIETVLGAPLALPQSTGSKAHGAGAPAVTAPGQLASHYAPQAAVRLQAQAPQPDEIWLGFGPDCPGAALNLSPQGDLVAAAAALFHLLHEADALATARGARAIAVAPVPETGLGRAINDRLRRAAAPRP